MWVKNPNAGGVKIPAAVQTRVADRIRSHAKKSCSGKFQRLDIRFRGSLCYIDAYKEPEPPSEGLLKITKETAAEYLERLRNLPLHLCRLRYFGDEEKWSLAFYTYSHEKYELCVFHSGDFYGTPEEAFDVGAVYLQTD
jgi:hypothetical protein